MTSQIHTSVGPTKVGLIRDAQRTAHADLKRARSQSSPELGVISNFDADQRGLTSDALQGFVMLQKPTGSGSVGELAVFADYNKVAPAPGQLASQNNNPTNPDDLPSQPKTGATDTLVKKQLNILRPVPGQPQIIYPVAAGGSSANLSFVMGGKVDYVRTYPNRLLIRNHRSFTRSESLGDIGQSIYGPENTVVFADSADFFHDLDVLHGWSENSPLPPGMRYIELNDMRWGIFTQFGIPDLSGIGIGDFVEPALTSELDSFTDFNSLLPHAYWDPLTQSSSVNIRSNIKPLPATAWFNLNEIYRDDTYWTGDAADPLNWKDSYWDGLDRDPTGKTPRVDRVALADWLKDHPKAVLKE